MTEMMKFFEMMVMGRETEDCGQAGCEVCTPTEGGF